MIRRPGFRFNRGRFPAGGAMVVTPPGTDPPSILGGALLAWWRADLGVTESGGAVSAWADQSGNGNTLIQATGGAKPTFGAASGPNGTAAITFDGADDILHCAGLNRPAPGTEPTYVWMIVQQVTWNGGSALFGATAAFALVVRQGGTEPELQQLNFDTSNESTFLPMTTWGRLGAWFSGSTDDYLQLVGALVQGDNSGNENPSGFEIGAASGAAPSNIIVAECLIANIEPMAGGGEEALLNDYVLARYGAGLF